MNKYLVAIALSLILEPAMAQVDADARPTEIPPPPPPVAEGESELPPPTVTIRRENGQVVETYSSGGVVYMVRVTPNGGPSYYLMDMDGDGVLEKTDLTLEPNLKIPHWVIFDW